MVENKIALIPAYEPQDNLISLVHELKENNFEVVVIDDGSGKEFKYIFDEVSSCAKVLGYNKNKGKGVALKVGFEYIKSNSMQDYVVVTMDCDGQHTVSDAKKLCEVAKLNPNTLVIGKRLRNSKTPFRSRLGNRITRLIYHISTGIDVYDTQTGLRAFNKALLDYLIKVEGERYEYEMNVLLAASKSFPILEVPIETVYINDNEGSHFRPIRDGLMIYKDMFKFALSSLSSFIVDYLVYAFFLFVMMAVPISLRILLANGIARVTSSIFNYSTNKHLVFKNKDSVAKTGSGYFGLALGLFILDTLLIRLFYTAFGLNLLISKIVVGFLLFLVSWVIQKKVIFKERTATHHEIL